jgi:nucleotide-binding universal stress UspA family protein
VRPIRRVGVAYDGSSQSRSAVREARELAADHCAQIEARHVVQLPTYGEADAWHLLNPPSRVISAARQRLGDIGIDDLSVVVGAVRPSLLTFSQTIDALFCGSRQYGAIRRIALGSTSDYLAHRARCPLFVTPTLTDTSADEPLETGFPRAVHA